MHSPLPPGRQSSPWMLGTLLFALSCSSLNGCKSAQTHAEDADREVYELLLERSEIFKEAGSFSIERPAETLRGRILAEQDPGREFDLLECLEVASENSRRYQDQRESLYLSALDLTLERWQFSVHESGSFGAFLNGTGKEADNAGILSDLGITRLLGTGLQIIGNVGFDFSRDLSSGAGWDALSNLSLNITQPLLRGFGAAIVQEPLTQAERNLTYAVRDYNRFRATFAFDVCSRFFRLLEQEEVLANEVRNFEGVVRLRERNEAFAEAGLLNDIQVDQARQNELSARNRVIGARRRFQSAVDDFKFFLGLPIEMRLNFKQGDRESLGQLEALQLDFKGKEELVIRTALERRYDQLTRIDRLADAKRRMLIAADDLRAGLGLTLSGAASSKAGRPLDYSGEDSSWRLGLDIDMPWDRLRERNVYRARLITVEATQRALDEGADSIRLELRDQLRLLEVSRESIEIQTQAVGLAERRVESAELNLEAGRSDTRTVLDAQESLVAASNAATNARTEFILNGLGLYRDMELLDVGEAGIDVNATPLLEELEEEMP